jgi:hypothetical protein
MVINSMRLLPGSPAGAASAAAGFAGDPEDVDVFDLVVR